MEGEGLILAAHVSPGMLSLSEKEKLIDLERDTVKNLEKEEELEIYKGILAEKCKKLKQQAEETKKIDEIIEKEKNKIKEKERHKAARREEELKKELEEKTRISYD